MLVTVGFYSSVLAPPFVEYKHVFLRSVLFLKKAKGLHCQMLQFNDFTFTDFWMKSLISVQRESKQAWDYDQISGVITENLLYYHVNLENN